MAMTAFARSPTIALLPAPTRSSNTTVVFDRMLRVQAQTVWRERIEIPVGCPQHRIGSDGGGSDDGIPGAKTRMGGEQARRELIGFSCGLQKRIGAELLLVPAPNGLVTK